LDLARASEVLELDLDERQHCDRTDECNHGECLNTEKTLTAVPSGMRSG
jgi:hypothetical protein